MFIYNIYVIVRLLVLFSIMLVDNLILYILDPYASVILSIFSIIDIALYNQSFLAHSTIGANDGLLSTYSLAKRPKFLSANHLPMYPQRPGEKDCVHYMLTRTCKFGEACKFDHPVWVPEGGIPDWKEVTF